MLVSFDSYRIFYYVAKCKSISRAAEMLLSSQPNVTRSIRNLEAALDCKLFLRSNRGVRLTPEGEELYAHVAVACEEIQRGEEALVRSKALKGGHVSIGVSEIALHTVLLSTLERFRKQYGGIRIRISNHSTPQALAALRQGMVDLALVTDPTEAQKPLQETRLKSFSEILIGGRRFRELARSPLGLRDIASLPLVGLGPRTATYSFYRSLFSKEELLYTLDMEAATADQVLPMVKSDLGLGFLPEHFAKEALEKGEVFRIPLVEEAEGKIPRRHVCLVRDETRPKSIALRELENYLMEEKEKDIES